jgi:hypothetical protein
MMPIQPNREWGSAVGHSVDGVAVRAMSDHAVAEAVARGVEPLVRGGDLHQAIGAPTGDIATRRLPIDLIELEAIDDGSVLATGVAHVVLRRSRAGGWWRGPVTMIANSEFIRGRQALPRAHPNDGMLDRLDVDAAMTPRQRVAAMRRARLGDHLPHPSLVVARGTSFVIENVDNVHIEVDGRRIAIDRAFRVSVYVDGGTVLA